MEVRPIDKRRTCIEWYSTRHYIDFKPDYQRRGSLWPKKNRALLINSILNGFDIPKIYFADFTYGPSALKQKSKLYAIIDGKQRLSAIFEFFDGELELGNDPVEHGGHVYNLSGYNYGRLKDEHEDLAKLVDNFELTIMSVFTEEVRHIRELFIRLNLNVSISGPEKRNAMHGPLPKIIRDLSVHPVLLGKAKFPNNRGQDLNSIAKLLLIQHNERYGSLGAPSLDRFVKSNQNAPESNFEQIKEKVRSVLDKMYQVFKNEDSLLDSQNKFVIFSQFVGANMDDDSERLRSFLAKFEQERTVAAKKAKAGETAEIKPEYAELISYNLLFRSPDNQSSMDSMESTLQRYYNRYKLGKF